MDTIPTAIVAAALFISLLVINSFFSRPQQPYVVTIEPMAQPSSGGFLLILFAVIIGALIAFAH